MATFEALRWLSDQDAAFVMLDRDGSVSAVSGQFHTATRLQFFSLAGQFTTSEKLCAFAVSGDVFARNRPSGATS